MSTSTKEEQQLILDGTNLYVKGLWRDCSQIDLDDIFHPYGVICQSRVYGNGIGFVRYETHQEACAAILALNNTKPHPRCPQPLVVQFAHKKYDEPKPNVGNNKGDMTTRANTKNVYIRNLPKMNFTEADFNMLCQKYGAISCIRLCNDFGFVRYFNESCAQHCVHDLHGRYLPYSTSPLVVKLANSDPFESKAQPSSTSSSPLPSQNLPGTPPAQSQSVEYESATYSTVCSTSPSFSSATSGSSVCSMDTSNPNTLPIGINAPAPMIPMFSVGSSKGENIATSTMPGVLPLFMNTATTTNNSSFLTNCIAPMNNSLLPFPQSSTLNPFYLTPDSLLKLLSNSQNMILPYVPAVSTFMQPTHFGPNISSSAICYPINDFSNSFPKVTIPTSTL